MRYGYFDDARREYVITDPRTPLKWINYVGTLAFGGLVDHTGGALLCKQDPALNRITRYLTLNPASDFKGETLYLRLKLRWGYQLIAPYFVPCLTPYQRYECRIGLGYTRIVSEMGGVRCEATIFVPPGADCEVRDMRITNISSQAIELDAIPLVEYSHFDALKQLTNADWVPQTMQSRAHYDEEGRVVLEQYAFMHKEQRVNYFTSNLAADSFETERRHFLGANEYGTWADPLALREPYLGCHEAKRGDNIAALLHDLGVLQPGESRRLITQLGQAPSLVQAGAQIERYRNPEAVEAALAEQAAGWQNLLAVVQVKTPDAAFNSMLNIHNPRQCHTTFNWSRYLSLYQLGYGARGIGFRDSSQDVLGIMPFLPQEARQLITRLLRVQKLDGSAMHQFNPLSMQASVGDAAERDDRPHYYSDDALWIVLAVAAYLKETGDFDFLNEELPYYNDDHSERAVARGSVAEHLRRALEFTHSNCGVHGLPLLGFADWNDTMNLPPGSESCFSACLYGKALLEMIEIETVCGDPASVQHFRGYYDEIYQAFNQHAWDGDWFVSYFNERGEPLGSQRNRAGQIYAYPQAWAVIAGFAGPQRARQALESVYHRLNTRNGIKLSTPGFDHFDPHEGGITTYPPGAKENGGIFLHVNPWLILAETLLGNGERAYRYYAQINPATRNERIDEFESEPYVYPQNMLGDEHPQFGAARNSWLSGTAAWMELVGTQHVLGIRPTYQGLCVDPCIPPAWDGFEVVRRYRQALYRIQVRNPQHVSGGVSSLLVDGQPVMGQLVPLFSSGEHTVEVVLGKNAG